MPSRPNKTSDLQNIIGNHLEIYCLLGIFIMNHGQIRPPLSGNCMLILDESEHSDYCARTNPWYPTQRSNGCWAC